MTDHITVSINELEFDQSITVGQIEMSEGASTDTDPSTIVVQCVEKQAAREEEELAPAAGGAEPEVIGKKDQDEDGGDS